MSDLSNWGRFFLRHFYVNFVILININIKVKLLLFLLISRTLHKNVSKRNVPNWTEGGKNGQKLYI